MKKYVVLLLFLCQSAFADPGGRSIYPMGGGGGGYPMGGPPPGHGGPTFQGYTPEQLRYLIPRDNPAPAPPEPTEAEIRANCPECQAIRRDNEERAAVRARQRAEQAERDRIEQERQRQQRRSESIRRDVENRRSAESLIYQRMTNEITNPCRGCPNPTCNNEAYEKQGRRIIQENPACNCGGPNCGEEIIDRNRVKIVSQMPVHSTHPAADAIDVNAIPDPDQIDYTFQTDTSIEGMGLKRIYTDLYKINPPTELRREAKTLGMIAVKAADQRLAAWQQNLDDQTRANFEFLHEVATGFLELATGLNPTTGTALSAYELIMGKNFFTGRSLTTTERTFAAVGVLSLGTSRFPSSAIQAINRGMNRIYQGARSRLLSNPMLLLRHVSPALKIHERSLREMGEFGRGHIITKIETAAEANARFPHMSATPPYLPGSYVTHFKTGNPTEFVRAHRTDNQPGSWLVKRGEIEGLTPAQIKSKLNLPGADPTHISTVHVPAETHMSRGMTNGNAFPGEDMIILDNQVQYRLESRIDPTHFGTPREIGERLVF